MEKQADHNAAGTQGADNARVDLAALSQDRLADPNLSNTGDSRAPVELTQSSFPSFHDDDLPAPSFIDKDLPTPSFHDDDLPAPVFHDDDLPAPTVHTDDFPADLTNFGLGRLLGLQLSSAALPTVGEVIRAVSQSAEPTEPEPEEEKQKKKEEEPKSENEDASSGVTPASDLSFIDPQSLTEQAATNGAASEVESEYEAEIFGSGIFDLEEGLGLDGLGLNDDFFTPAGGEVLPPEESSGGDSGGGGGGGTNVINGSAGDDILNGTAGDDLIHGFAGNDTIDGGVGADRLDGGLGDDVLVWDSADAVIDGKGGTDTLRVDNGDIDLTSFGGSVSRLESIDLQSDVGANIISLTAQNVLDATDAANILTITGDAGDSLEAGNGWTDGGVDGGGNQIYTQVVGSSTATLVVDPDITSNANILL
ncbi:MAG: hypothetical protein HKN28_09690 [Alphaproteobacteria bacterium]|nr:hypothetical protein [Alphaproteobacteria bacterium]